MQADPFEPYSTPSEYHRDGSEEESLQRVHDRIASQVSQQQPPRSGHLLRIAGWTAVAAALFLLVIFKPFGAKGHQELAAAFFTPYPNYVTAQERGDRSESTVRDAALAAYDAGQFNQAIALFGEMENKATAMDRFYLAQALQATGAWERALDELLALGDVGPEYRPAVRWYTALSRLAVGDHEVARSILIPLITSDTEFASEARKLLDDL